MALERATVKWPTGETYYFLSPDGEYFLEVRKKSYDLAPEHTEDYTRLLEDKIAGRNGTTMQIKMTKLYLDRFRHDEGFEVSFS